MPQTRETNITKSFSIKFESINRAVLGIDCQSYKFTATPTLKVDEVKFLGLGANDAYTFAFFEVKVRIDWKIVGKSPKGNTISLSFATEFSVEWVYRQLTVLLLEPTKLKWLKLLSRLQLVKKATEWLATLPMVIKMYQAVEESMTKLCNDPNLERRIQDIFHSETWRMECQTKFECA